MPSGPVSQPRPFSGHLGGAGLDVWYRYPTDARSRQDSLPAKRAFWELDNVVMSPHRAGRTAGSQKRRVEALVTLLGELEAGRRPCPIDVRAGY